MRIKQRGRALCRLLERGIEPIDASTRPGYFLATGIVASPGLTIPVTDIIVSSFGNAAVLQSPGTGGRADEVGGWSGTAGGRIIIRDTAPCMRGLERKESAKPRH